MDIIKQPTTRGKIWGYILILAAIGSIVGGIIAIFQIWPSQRVLLTSEEFKEALVKHRKEQKEGLSDNLSSLSEMVAGQLNLKVQQFDDMHQDELAFIREITDAVLIACKQYYKKHGYPTEMFNYRPPAKKSGFKNLATWVENREDRLQPIETCLGNIIKLALYNRRNELFGILEKSKGDLEKMVLEVLKNNLEPGVISEEIVQKQDAKLLQIYKQEYKSIEIDEKEVSPLCESFKVDELFGDANVPSAY
jgi:hypothetical protein